MFSYHIFLPLLHFERVVSEAMAKPSTMGPDPDAATQAADAISAGAGEASYPANWGLVIVLGLIYTCAFVDRQVLSLLLEPVKHDLGATDFQMSLLLGLAFSLFYGILNIPSGYLVDRFGRRGLIGGAALAWSGMTMIGGLATSFGQLFISRAGVGVAEAVITPASFSLIRDKVSPARRSRAFSILGMAPYLGSSIALSGGASAMAAAQRGAFAGWPVIGSLHPWQAALFIIGLLGIPLPLLLLFIKRDVRHLSAKGQQLGANNFTDALRFIKANGQTYAALIAYVTLGAAIAFGKSAWTPAFMARRFHLPTTEIGYVLGPLALVSGVGGLVIFGWVIDRATARGRNIVGIAAFVMAGCTAFSILPQMVNTPGLAWLFYGIGNLFSGSFYAVGATLLARCTPAQFMGRITAIYLFFQGVVGSAFGPMVVGFISDRLFSGPLALGSALVSYYSVSGTLALAALFVLQKCSAREAKGAVHRQ